MSATIYRSNDTVRESIARKLDWETTTRKRAAQAEVKYKCALKVIDGAKAGEPAKAVRMLLQAVDVRREKERDRWKLQHQFHDAHEHELEHEDDDPCLTWMEQAELDACDDAIKATEDLARRCADHVRDLGLNREGVETIRALT